MTNDRKDELFGHPKGLYVLFFAEMWERFSFYGMRALLVLYMTDAMKYSVQTATGVYGAYTGFVYATPLVGGMLADRFLGYRRAIMIGGALMALGHFAMAIESPFYFYGALGLIIAGNGFFKPNISTMVGTLYPDRDPRRDGAFTIFYMGINIGAWGAPLLCGYLGERIGWHWGFSVAGVGMVFGLFVFVRWQSLFGEHGLPPRPAAWREPLILGIPKMWALYLAVALFVPTAAYVVAQPGWVITGLPYIGGAFALYACFEGIRSKPGERSRVFVVLILISFSVIFWACFEQAGSSINLFTRDHVDRNILGWEVPTSWGQSINPWFIIILGIPFSLMWTWLSRVKMSPSSPLKFAMALFQVALGFVAMVIAARQAAASPDGTAHLGWLVLAYFLHTTGELCLSPVGLSMVTKLAPARLAGMLMGMWFLSNAFANVLAGWIAGLTGGEGTGSGDNYEPVFKGIIYFAAIGAGVLLLLVPFLKRMEKGAE